MRFLSIAFSLLLALQADGLNCQPKGGIPSGSGSAVNIGSTCDSLTRDLTVSNAPARHFHRAISYISPSSSLFKKIFRKEDEHENIPDTFEQLFDENLWKWEVHSYMFWGEVLSILGVAWIVAVLIYYIPVLISRKCCCSLNWKRERTPFLGVLIPGSIFGTLALFIVAVMIAHTVFFSRSGTRAECVALETVHEALWGAETYSELDRFQITEFPGLVPWCEEVDSYIDQVDSTVDELADLPQEAVTTIKKIIADINAEARVIETFIDTASDLAEQVQDEVHDVSEDLDSVVDLVTIILHCIWALCLLNILLALWVFVHYYWALEYQDPIEKPGGFHTGFAGFLTFWFGFWGGILLLLAGLAWCILYFSSDACRVVQVNLIKNAEWNNYEMFKEENYAIPDEIQGECLMNSGGGSLYEVVDLNSLIEELKKWPLIGEIPFPADPDCKALLDLGDTVAKAFCDSSFGDLAMISWCVFFLGVLHFVAWIYVQRFWRHRQGMVDEEKKNRKKDEVASEVEEQPTSPSMTSERVSDDQFLVAAQYGDLEKVNKALDQRERPNECHDVLYNNSPLHLAAYFGHVSVVKVLLEKGYSPNERNFHQYTPFSACANNREIDFAIQTQVLRLLAQFGADVDTFDHQGDTPLLRATRAKNEPLVSLLLELGADPLIEDRMLGESSLALADTYREESPNLARILSPK